MKYQLSGLLLILVLLGATEHMHTASPVVPVICYHGIYTDQSKKPSMLAISRDQLNAQLKSLHDSGYHTILPDQLFNHLTTGASLPEKSILITFDDTRSEHFNIAAPLLERYGFRGVFFIMTVPIGKPGYMTADGIKALSDRGHVIAAHTWDHPHLSRIGSWDYRVQIAQPKQQLQQITGKPVLLFAYPFGEWNDSAISMLRVGGFKAAFQLRGRSSEKYPQYTLQRMMVDGKWSGVRLQQEINEIFTDDNHLR